MKRVIAILAAVACYVSCGQVLSADPSQQSVSSLNPVTGSKVQYLHDQAKLALDLNWVFMQRFYDPAFQSLGGMERAHMDQLLVLLRDNGLEPLVESRSASVYGVGEHADAYDSLRMQGWDSLLGAYQATAYVEEWDISEMRALIDSTHEQALVDTLTGLLSGAEDHLRLLVSRIKGLGHDYQAQLLSQSDVDTICSDVEPYQGTDFTLNSGLNDAWYYPYTPGQGFFVTFYPDSQTVFVSWMMFDVGLPHEVEQNGLGNSGQRWLVAQGGFNGNRAALKIYSASGGSFDRVTHDVDLDYIGDMIIQFDDCSSGTVWYTLWPLWGGYMIPIERVAPDNIVNCEMSITR